MNDVVEEKPRYTYSEFEREYYQAVDNFIDDLNMRFGSNLVYADFSDWWIKMQSTVVNVVNLEEG